MSLGDVVKDVWPYLATISTGGIVPFAYWLSKRIERKDVNQEKQEERRTIAQEAIVPAISSLQTTVQNGFNQQNKELGTRIDTMKTELLASIQGEQFNGLRELIRQQAISNPNDTIPPGSKTPIGLTLKKVASNE